MKAVLVGMLGMISLAVCARLRWTAVEFERIRNLFQPQSQSPTSRHHLLNVTFDEQKSSTPKKLRPFVHALSGGTRVPVSSSGNILPKARSPTSIFMTSAPSLVFNSAVTGSSQARSRGPTAG